MNKRKYVKILFFMLVVFNVFTISSYAQTKQKLKLDDESMLLTPWQKTAKDIQLNNLRGSIISTGIAEIGNEGEGNISIYIQTLAHVECDEIFHRAYLDRWDDAKGAWYTVDKYEFMETKADHPDEKFTSLTSHFSVLKQPTGYYYRVRGIHTATLGTRKEVLSSKTDGVLVTK